MDKSVYKFSQITHNQTIKPLMQLHLIEKSEFTTPSKIDILCNLFEIESLINDAIRYKKFEGRYLNLGYLLKIQMERKKTDILTRINSCRKHLGIYPEYSEQIRQLTIQTNRI